MDSGFVFFGFSGTGENLPEKIVSEELQYWNLAEITYNEFKNRWCEATGVERIHDKHFSKQTYYKCKWGLLIPYLHSTDCALVLINLFSKEYLHPLFYFENGLSIDMSYSLPRLWGEINCHTQNPKQFSSQTNLDLFTNFYKKLQPISPYLAVHTDKLYGVQKKRIHKSVQIFDRIGQTYTSLDNDHEAFYLDFARLLECLLIADDYDLRGFCTKEYLKKRCKYLTKHFDFINILQGVSVSKTLNRIYGYRNKFAHGKTYLELNIMSMKNQGSGATGKNAEKHFNLRDDAKTLLRSVLISYFHLFLHKRNKRIISRTSVIEILSRVTGIPWLKQSRRKRKGKCRFIAVETTLSRRLLAML